MPDGAAEITGFHAHVYYDSSTRGIAAQLRAELEAGFDVTLGRWRDEPVGPHPKSMYQVAFSPELFGRVVPWLMLNHRELDVLIHPSTDQDVADHSDRALWLGGRLSLNLDFLRNLEAKAQKGPTGSNP